MNVAFLGTGLMGAPMAGQLLKHGHHVTVYNRTKEKTQPLAKQGAVVADTPAAAVKEGECVVLMLADAAAIEAVLFKGRCSLKGKTVIQMGTIAPQESRHFAAKVEKAGGRYLECPVLGSIKQAAQKKLILMAGADPEPFGKWRFFLQGMGQEPVLVGPVGSAAALKLAMNQLIASLMMAFAQSLGLVQASGIDVDIFMSILHQSALHAPVFDNKLPRLLHRDYDNPNFPVQHMLKDVKLFLATAADLGLDLTALEGVKTILEKTVNAGHRNEDYSVLYEGVRKKD